MMPTLSPTPAMLVTFSQAIDVFIGDLARRGRSQATRNSYRRLLNDFADVVHDKPPLELELTDYERFLDRWTDSSPSTLASGVSLVRSFSRFLHERGWASEDVAAPLRRPRRKRSEDLDVVTVSAEDVLRLLEACRKHRRRIRDSNPCRRRERAVS